MTPFDLILAYPLTALGVFLAAVAALWLCLSAALWAAWVLGWFDWWSEVARPGLAQRWREISKLWGGESAWPAGNVRGPGRPGHRRAHDSLRSFNSNGRSAVGKMVTPHLPRKSEGHPPHRPRSPLHSMSASK